MTSILYSKWGSRQDNGKVDLNKGNIRNALSCDLQNGYCDRNYWERNNLELILTMMKHKGTFFKTKVVRSCSSSDI